MSKTNIKIPLRHRIINILQSLDVRGIRWFAHRLPKWVIPAPGGPVVMQTLHGFSLHIDPVKDRGIERTLYYTGTYESGTLQILRYILCEGDTFVDVGANIGLISIFASRLVGPSGRVIAFEPNPETLDILRRNISLNRVENIVVSGEAVGSSPGEAIIYERWESNRGSASLIDPGFGEPGHRVAVTTLDQYFLSDSRKAATPRISVIKMDIEGYELEALRGTARILEGPDPPALIVEAAEQGKPLFGFLQGLPGYRMFRLKKGKNRTSSLVGIDEWLQVPPGENIFCLPPERFGQIPRGQIGKTTLK